MIGVREKGDSACSFAGDPFAKPQIAFTLLYFYFINLLEINNRNHAAVG